VWNNYHCSGSGALGLQLWQAKISVIESLMLNLFNNHNTATACAQWARQAGESGHVQRAPSTCRMGRRIVGATFLRSAAP
jgi:hypothetical protein